MLLQFFYYYSSVSIFDITSSDLLHAAIIFSCLNKYFFVSSEWMRFLTNVFSKKERGCFVRHKQDMILRNYVQH